MSNHPQQHFVISIGTATPCCMHAMERVSRPACIYQHQDPNFIFLCRPASVRIHIKAHLHTSLGATRRSQHRALTLSLARHTYTQICIRQLSTHLQRAPAGASLAHVHYLCPRPHPPLLPGCKHKTRCACVRFRLSGAPPKVGRLVGQPRARKRERSSVRCVLLLRSSSEQYK
jgi:hypothetical protein